MICGKRIRASAICDISFPAIASVVIVLLFTTFAYSESPPDTLVRECAKAKELRVAAASSPADIVPGIALTEIRTRQVQLASFPELQNVDIRIHVFNSRADYFRTRFSVSHFFLLMKMRYFVEVNPALFGQDAPPEGVCAILAHELVHVSSMSHGNRIHLLGFIRMLSKNFTAKLERRTDLEAIHRGYAEGLESYRKWVYLHVPASKLPEKRRNYFSPDEIENIDKRLSLDPRLFVYWRKHVPMNLPEILRESLPARDTQSEIPVP